MNRCVLSREFIAKGEADEREVVLYDGVAVCGGGGILC
jgi:hypothetical protein